MDPVEQYLQGLLTTRAGGLQNFSGRRTPFIGADVVPPATRELAEEIVNRLTVSPGQFTIPGRNEYLRNAYRSGATIRATGPGMVGNPQLNRFAEVPDQVAIDFLDRSAVNQAARVGDVPEAVMRLAPMGVRPRGRGTAGAIAGGLALGAAAAKYLSDPALQKNVNNEAAYIRDAILSGRIPYSPF